MNLCKKVWVRLVAVAVALTCVFALSGKIQAAGSSLFGDIDGNGRITPDDAVYLLLHSMFGQEEYPLNNTPGDIDGNGRITPDDAVYLLLHSMFGQEEYPLTPPASGDDGEEEGEVGPTVGPNGTPIV